MELLGHTVTVFNTLGSLYTDSDHSLCRPCPGVLCMMRPPPPHPSPRSLPGIGAICTQDAHIPKQQNNQFGLLVCLPSFGNNTAFHPKDHMCDACSTCLLGDREQNGETKSLRVPASSVEDPPLTFVFPMSCPVATELSCGFKAYPSHSFSIAAKAQITSNLGQKTTHIHHVTVSLGQKSKLTQLAFLYRTV